MPCEYCGTLIYKTQTNLKRHKHHYCSNICQGKKKREECFENRKCEVCGEEMYVSKKSSQRFCSNKCQNIWQLGNVGFKNKRFQGGYVKCENCGKDFIVGKNILNDNRHHFCSTPCRQNWYSKVWSKSDAWKEESKRRAVNILSSRPINTQTKPQIKTNKILDELGISYRNEEPFVYYSVDNYLPDYNLAIEVMGDYWHSSPLKYREKTNTKQKHIISRDKAKHTYLLNEYGIEILYLWESDINTNPELCRMLIQKYIKNKGIIENYNSFNYSIQNNTLVLNNNIIFTHQEKIAC